MLDPESTGAIERGSHGQETLQDQGDPQIGYMDAHPSDPPSFQRFLKTKIHPTVGNVFPFPRLL